MTKILNLIAPLTIKGTRYIVQQMAVHGTDKVSYTAWEPTDINAPDGGPHSTVTTFTTYEIAGWWGRIGTNPSMSRAQYQHLPVGPERSEMLQLAYQEQYDRAIEVITSAFSVDLNEIDRGEVIVRIPKEEILS